MSLFTVFATSKIAASALAAGALAVGGTGAAAYAGALPSDVQQGAHDLVGAPAPRTSGISQTAAASDATASATPSASAAATGAVDGKNANASVTAAGPDAAGPSALGLCTAFVHGGLATSSTGFKSLSVAAKGETNVEGFCADVIETGKTTPKAEVSGSGNAAGKVDVPELPAAPKLPAAPELPTQAAVPAAPALPSQVPTGSTDLPSPAGRP
jgi:hypothetical protein